MVGQARPIEKYGLIRCVVPKLGPRGLRYKGLALERGGVFAQMIGTLELLAPHELKRVVGEIINEAPRSKLRGIRRRGVSSAEMPRYLRMSRRSSRNGREFRSWGSFRCCAILPWIRKTT